MEPVVDGSSPIGSVAQDRTLLWDRRRGNLVITTAKLSRYKVQGVECINDLLVVMSSDTTVYQT
jgi:hypothetical protein